MPSRPGWRAPPHLELAALRKEAAAYLGIDPVEPVPLARVRPSQLLMLAATFFGLWLLVQQFVGFGEIVPVLAGASWWWVAATLVITQTTAISEAVAMSGAVPAPLPLGPLVLLRMAMWFTGLIGGTAAGTRPRWSALPAHGLASIVAVSSGLIYSVGGFCVQVVLSVAALIFAGDEFHLEPPAGRVRGRGAPACPLRDRGRWSCRRDRLPRAQGQAAGRRPPCSLGSHLPGVTCATCSTTRANSAACWPERP